MAQLRPSGVASAMASTTKSRKSVRSKPAKTADDQQSGFATRIAFNPIHGADYDVHVGANLQGILNPADTTRIARALEVVLSTGRTLAQWQEQREGGIGRLVELRPLILLPPRDWLYLRCDERFAAMFESGAVDEVQRLLARKLDPRLPAMRGIGVREISAFLAGETSRDEAIAAGQQATRRYAKRQYTWFAHQPPAEWPRFTAPLEGEHVAEAAALLK